MFRQKNMLVDKKKNEKKLNSILLFKALIG